VRFAKTWDANLALQGFANAFTDSRFVASPLPWTEVPRRVSALYPSTVHRSKRSCRIMETTVINATEYRNVSLSLLSESKTNPRRSSKTRPCRNWPRVSAPRESFLLCW